MPTRSTKAKPASPTKSKSLRATVRAPATAKRAAGRRHEELLLSGGDTHGAPFGRCGGRPIVHAIERSICDRLTDLGVAHSHRPRHFEIRLEDESLAAFAPTMVLRGRGREGKTVIVETAEHLRDPNLVKVRSFRKQYGLEFYVCFVAPEEVLDTLSFETYDEAASVDDMHTLVSRLAD